MSHIRTALMLVALGAASHLQATLGAASNATAPTYTPATMTKAPLTSGDRPISSNATAVQVAPAAQQLAKSSSVTFFKKSLSEFPVYHESGAQLFPTNSHIASLFDEFITALKQPINYSSSPTSISKEGPAKGEFSHYFKKIQLAVLYDLYHHLTALYTNLNVTFAKDVWNHLRLESEYNLNTKTLIVNHLLALVSTQIESIIASHFKNDHKSHSISLGKRLLKHDYGSALHLFTLQNEAEFVDAYGTMISDGYADKLHAAQVTQEVAKNLNTFRKESLDVFKKYHTFMDAYTHTLVSTNQTTKNNAFSKLAQDVKAAVQNSKASQNPGVFYYSQEALRAVELIPSLCNDITPGSKKIDWQSNIVNAAKKGENIQNIDSTPTYTRFAFFTIDDPSHKGQQKATQTPGDDPSAKLFINMIVNKKIHVQELIKQPSWMDSKEGIIRFLRGCLGDYQKLIGLDILDPCVEGIIMSAIGDPGADKQMKKCKTFLCVQKAKSQGKPAGDGSQNSKTKNAIAKCYAPTAPTSPTIPDGPTGPTNTGGLGGLGGSTGGLF
jgi:hypothetical protein